MCIPKLETKVPRMVMNEQPLAVEKMFIFSGPAAAAIASMPPALPTKTMTPAVRPIMIMPP